MVIETYQASRSKIYFNVVAMLSYFGQTMTNINWMVCQLLIIIGWSPLQGLITEKPACESSLGNEVFQVEGFYFWSPCNYKFLPEAKKFCSTSGAWQHEPKTEAIAEYIKTGLPFEYYFQGLEKKDGAWRWLQGGVWDNIIPERESGDTDDDTCSTHDRYVWQHNYCESHRRRYICQFPACSDDDDCSQYELCVTSEYDTSLKFCTCKDGYYGIGCTDQYCSPECTDGGTCTAEGNSRYSCQCFDGFYGETCNNDYCVEGGNPCMNGGTCKGLTTDPYYECKCTPGYYGATCSNDYCDFHPGTCENGGTCTSTLGTADYNCNCRPEYTGTNCENKRYYNDGDCKYYINKNEVYAYDAATEQCTNYGGALSMVKTDRIQTFLQSTFDVMYGDTAFDVWVGGEKGDSWKWLDDEIIGYSGYDNWAADEPSGFGESVLMRRNNDAWKWYGVAKSHENVGIICEKPVVANSPCLESNNPCQNGECRAIGCQVMCICDSGYFQRYCDEDLVTIQSDEQRIGVENENLTLSFEITTFDGPLTVIVMKDGSEESTLTDVDNGIVNYLIVNVQTSDNGSTYTFTASSQSGEYNRSASTEVIVHVRAYVDELETTSLYAPQSEGCTKNVTCTVGGTPTPTDYGWYRNGFKLSESEDDGVYQTIDGLQSTLFVQNAIVADRGEYSCYAENMVAYESNVSYAKSSVTLSVYSAPINLKPVATPCSEIGEIQVDWDADTNTNGIDHRFSISQQNGTGSYSANKSAINGDQVIFDELDPYTTYTIHVEVCPESECCIAKLTKTAISTTGHGLPSEVSSTMNGVGTTVCVISWNSTETPIDQVEGYNILWTAKINDGLSYEVNDIEGADYVDAPQMNYSLQTKANKIYQVKVSARTCAGNGTSIEATGECRTPIEGPDEIPEPSLDKVVTKVRQETQEIIVQMVNDESNGAISCLFVILYKDNEGTLPQSLSDLQQLSSNGAAKKVEGGYIAVAINRGEVEIGEAIQVTLGNDITTGCNAALRDMTSREQTDFSSFIEAKNIPLDYRGVEYSVLTVTTSPDSDGNVIVTYDQNYTEIGDLPKFTQGTSLVWVTACVLIPIIVIAGAVFAWIRHKRNTLEKKSGGSPTFATSSLGDIGDDIYETIDPTTIPLKRLKEYYFQMEANECMLFREQFVKLKQEAKKVAPSSTYAGSAEVMMKNRFRNILPYDTNRVCLKGQGHDSYINASYIKGCDKAIIATQGPMRNTIIDFWRMVVEQACTVIVMLAKCEENGKKQCERYWPALNCEVSYGAYGIANVGEKVSDGIVKTELKVKANGQKEISVIHYLYQRWPEHSILQTTSSFLRLHKHVNGQLNNTGKRTIVVHCSSGAGRTGTFIGFDLLSDKSKTSLDIYDCVLEMNKQRMNMVQTLEQYETLHQLLVEHHRFGETDVDRRKLFQKYGSEVMKEFDLLRDLEALNLKIQEHCQGQVNKSLGEPTDEEWGTIHATAVEAYQGNLFLIASRGPSAMTVEKFLIALWDNHVEEVIMLNNPRLEAKSIEVNFCEYWPKQPNTTVTYNSISITLQKEDKIRNTVQRTFLLHRRNRQDRMIKQSQYLGWRIGEMPAEEDQIFNIMKRIIAFDQEITATILVHCTDGLKRSGIFIAVLNILARLQSENRIDVFRTVKDLRDIRPGMIPTQIDYVCCYDLAKNFLSKPNEYVNEALMNIGTEDLITYAAYQII